LLRRFFLKGVIEAGCDEAGRGCLAGPVLAAAVILPAGFSHKLLNDSKQMTEEARNLLRPVIEEKAIAWAVASVSNAEIDEINILNASFLAMHRALSTLTVTPELLLIDGNRFKQYKTIEHRCIVKGDSIYASIAAASVLAKTHRDEYMQQIHQSLPVYGWNRNKGYPTISHRNAIRRFGVTAYHRSTFNLYGTSPQANLFKT